ncbi:MAG: helix-turn-helix transcriptional regulator [Brotaphodocola sp.]
MKPSSKRVYSDRAMIHDLLEKTAGIQVNFLPNSFSELKQYDIMLEKCIRQHFFDLTQLEEQTLYCVQDMFQVEYLITRHQMPEDMLIITGPFLTNPPTEFFIISVMTQNHIHSGVKTQLEEYYRHIPVIETSTVRYLACIIGQYFYGCDTNFSFNVIFYRSKKKLSESLLMELPELTQTAAVQLEQVSALENLLFQEIRSGDRKHALQFYDRLCKIVSAANSDVVSDIELCKSYSYSLIALCRRAAQEAGVPPTVVHMMATHHHTMIRNTSFIDQINENNIRIISQFIELIQNLFLSHYGKYVQSTMEYIALHIDCEITLAELAAHVQLSPTYLAGIFKAETGRSIITFINEKKMIYARLLLKNTSITVQEIAHHLGYQDTSYFIRVFRKNNGMTPSAYRSQCHQAAKTR